MRFATFDILGAQELDSRTVTFRVFGDAVDFARPLDVTGWPLRSIVRIGPTAMSAEASSNFVLEVVNAKEGAIRATLPKNHSLSAGVYWYSIRGKDAQNAEKVLLNGRLLVAASEFAP